MNLEELKSLVASGKRQRYLFFWGHTAKNRKAIGAECLSQWYRAAFECEGNRYPTSEHFMMAEKAKMFGDSECREKILTANSPGAAKALGREVRGFQEERWQRARYDIVVRANSKKFSQNHELGEFLLNTKKRILAEASPRDRIWGIGLAKEDPHSENPLLWRGSNLLGFALMDVRDALS